MLHGCVASAEHSRLCAGHVQGMGEIRAGLNGLQLIRVALCIERVKNDPPRDDDPVLLAFHALDHRHAPGGKHPRFLPQAARQRDLPFHHSLSLSAPHQPLHLYILPQALHLHLSSPLHDFYKGICGGGGWYAREEASL